MIFLLTSSSIFLFLVLQVFSTSLNDTKLMVIAGFAFIMGSIAAIYLTRFSIKYGVALLTSCCFLSFSFIVVPLLNLSEFKHHNKIKMAIYSGCAIFGFIIGAHTARGIQVTVTSFIGAYLFVRGISLYLGGFINEFDLADIDPQAAAMSEEEQEILAENMGRIQPIFYGYMASIVFMFVLGIIVQRRQIITDRFKYEDQVDDDKIKDPDGGNLGGFGHGRRNRRPGDIELRDDVNHRMPGY